MSVTLKGINLGLSQCDEVERCFLVPTRKNADVSRSTASLRSPSLLSWETSSSTTSRTRGGGKSTHACAVKVVSPSCHALAHAWEMEPAKSPSRRRSPSSRPWTATRSNGTGQPTRRRGRWWWPTAESTPPPPRHGVRWVGLSCLLPRRGRRGGADGLGGGAARWWCAAHEERDVSAAPASPGMHPP